MDDWQSIVTTLGASVSKQVLLDLAPKEGETITVLELAFGCPSDGLFETSYKGKQLRTLYGGFLPGMADRLVVNMALEHGDHLIIYGTSVTGGDFSIFWHGDVVE